MNKLVVIKKNSEFALNMTKQSILSLIFIIEILNGLILVISWTFFLFKKIGHQPIFRDNITGQVYTKSI